MKRTTKRTDDGLPHWLDKAEPNFAPQNNLWRVRIMRMGQKYNWWIKSGKGDPTSTGKILAI
ncbi:MAG: hypothetical protein JWP03_1553, partial [Phycisphaerales bacterium]|nr:hypothetical protein [Phycisphaerales bacterium]